MKHTLSNPSSAIALAEIQIPDDIDFGTGTFTTIFLPAAFTASSAIVSGISIPPHVSITATLHLNRAMPVLLGREQPVDRRIFELPARVRHEGPHTLVIEFAEWRITAASFDGQPLGSKASHHN